ncbi:hypothetical protein [Actinokineospora iranica]|uniref:Uncharacterized protein n=1 Tax=Actinokineospora iranica TaxID=1271860 RepID=A0A1G6TNW2_9PSEU|nr:hypothetical protein [Actinokineospora iranica]SDD30741.1 hypothetical protein SAMN05216174_109240 [Actinokineospora iranica]
MASPQRRLRAFLRGPGRLPIGLAAAIGCLGVAVLYATVLAVQAPARVTAAHAFVMRWAQPAVWIALAAVCLEYALRADRAVLNRTATLAVAVYLAFLLAISFA